MHTRDTCIKKIPFRSKGADPFGKMLHEIPRERFDALVKQYVSHDAH